jgi:signal transduction histidine kinase
MQAHPLSSTAARITPTPLLASHRTSFPASIPAPARKRLPLTGTFGGQSPALASLAETIGLAHDAGNFLAALGLYCDLLSAPGVLGPRHKHYAEELSLISNRSSALIQRFLSHPVDPQKADISAPSAPTPAAVGRCDAPHPVQPKANCNLAAVLRSLAPVLQSIAGGAATVSITCPNSLPPVDLSSEILERLAVNLVRNAAEAIRVHRRDACTAPLPPCGQIQVSIAAVGPTLRLTVKDNGPGMPPAAAAAFLHPSPLPAGARHGMGHRIIHQLAASTRGKMAIHVVTGGGTAFSLEWPIQTARSPTNAPPVQA